MEYFEELTVDVLEKLDPECGAQKIVISRDLMSDVVRHMSMYIDPCLCKELIAKGYIGVVHYTEEQTAPRWTSRGVPLFVSADLSEGTLHVCYED